MFNQYIVVYLIFSPKIILISKIFDEYERLHNKYLTIFASVLYRTNNLSPSVRISDTTRPLILQINAVCCVGRVEIQIEI